MIRVRVPATSANLGPGFDIIGAAWNIYNIFECEEIEEGVEINVEGAPDISKEEDNAVYKAFKKAFEYKGEKPPKGIRINIRVNIPTKRGLGSSATAYLGGLLLANRFLSKPLKRKELLSLAVELEGHPDNVYPAFFGGITLAYNKENSLEPYRLRVRGFPAETFVLVPPFGVPTEEARKVLPKSYSKEEVIFNMRQVSLLITALEEREPELLRWAFEDRIHQPYRASLVPGMYELFEESISLGAYGGVLSGAGPSLLFFAPLGKGRTIASKLAEKWSNIINGEVKIIVTDIDYRGATLMEVS
ncbi:MAG: homoserine kinase [Synergistetes bacterium]|nr:homoserine kinase [Synergistota bacterium]MCX8127670.1 homoserine kinase [Synergistota bacterium]MDW8191415.1 homoserine kinase [Synergistota bacterium]